MSKDTREQEVKVSKTIKLTTVLWAAAIVFAFIAGWFAHINYISSVNATIDQEVTKRFEQAAKTNQ